MTAATCVGYRSFRATIAARARGAGPTLVLGDQRFLVLDRGVTHVGRSLSADLQLEDHSASSRHAVLVNSSRGVFLLDDTSTYGTFVNGKRISRVQLKSGDKIRIGRVIFQFLNDPDGATCASEQATEEMRVG
jgi:pSer/pThr/pTyr-binding forkhead associated (FHA) protein